jgi:hypothetical protein
VCENVKIFINNDNIRCISEAICLRKTPCTKSTTCCFIFEYDNICFHIIAITDVACQLTLFLEIGFTSWIVITTITAFWFTFEVITHKTHYFVTTMPTRFFPSGHFKLVRWAEGTVVRWYTCMILSNSIFHNLSNDELIKKSRFMPIFF